MTLSHKQFNITVLAPHIDDEVIGAGGSIAKHIDLGHRVNVIYINSGNDEKEVNLRETEAKNVCSFLNISSYSFLRADISSLNDKTEKEVVKILREQNTDFLYAPHKNDGDIDHIKIYDLAKRVQWLANKSKNYYSDLPGECSIKGLFLYEVHNPIGEVHYFEDVSDFAVTKKRALELYKSQIEKVNYAESALALNKYRGISSEICEYAEGFQLHGFRDIFSSFKEFAGRF